jgi:hypothetical protein
MLRLEEDISRKWNNDRRIRCLTQFAQPIYGDV